MKYIRVLAAVALLAFVGTATAEMLELQDETLGAVTAGTDSVDLAASAGHAAGGTVVANGSAANVDNTNEIALEDGAQDSARAVNVVNAASSLVAQGLNIWDGQLQNGGLETDSIVEQSNLVVQSQTTRSATVSDYQRDLSSAETSSLSTTADNLDTIDLQSDVMVDTSHTVLGQNVNAGMGVGVAGRVDIDLGPVEIGVALEATSTIDIGVGVTGTIDLPWPLGSMEAGGELTMLIENEGSFTIDLSTPEISIDAIGSVCYTKLGICTAVADDNSTYATNTTSDEMFSLETQGALSVDRAEAEYIVIDESTLEIVSGNSLRLASNAQANLAAVNAVNAVGSLVANGLNVSRTGYEGTDVAATLHLTQRNVVIQGM